jgi:hypothetical protein
VHSHITLILPHHDDHRPPSPVVELHDDTDREATVTFREADDECAELVGCPECLVGFLRATAEVLEEQLRQGRWVTSD